MEDFKLLVDKIESENEVFDKLSKANKRVVIAQDCIDRIKVKQLNPVKGSFISPSDISYLKRNNSGNESLKNVINNCDILAKCSACAKGGLFLSFVGRANKVNVNELEGSNYLKSFEHQKLLEVFTKGQLALIEAAYEGVQYIGNANKPNRIYLKGGEKDAYGDVSFPNYIRKYPESKRRLIAICKNIIKNKGTFVY